VLVRLLPIVNAPCAVDDDARIIIAP
jgi:hypothetical protein